MEFLGDTTFNRGLLYSNKRDVVEAASGNFIIFAKVKMMDEHNHLHLKIEDLSEEPHRTNKVMVDIGDLNFRQTRDLKLSFLPSQGENFLFTLQHGVSNTILVVFNARTGRDTVLSFDTYIGDACLHDESIYYYTKDAQYGGIYELKYLSNETTLISDNLEVLEDFWYKPVRISYDDFFGVLFYRQQRNRTNVNKLDEVITDVDGVILGTNNVALDRTQPGNRNLLSIVGSSLFAYISDKLIISELKYEGSTSSKKIKLINGVFDSVTHGNFADTSIRIVSSEADLFGVTIWILVSHRGKKRELRQFIISKKRSHTKSARK